MFDTQLSMFCIGPLTDVVKETLRGAAAEVEAAEGATPVAGVAAAVYAKELRVSPAVETSSGTDVIKVVSGFPLGSRLFKYV